MRHWIINYDFLKHSDAVESFKQSLPLLPSELQIEFTKLLQDSALILNTHDWAAHDEAIKKEITITIFKPVKLKLVPKKRLTPNNIKFCDVNAIELARQICLYHQQEFRNVFSFIQ